MSAYFRHDRNHWLRIGRVQLGLHLDGRMRLFSERNGYRKGIPTLRIGRTAEVSACITRKPGGMR